MAWYLHRNHVDSFSGWFVDLFVVTLAWGDESKHISGELLQQLYWGVECVCVGNVRFTTSHQPFYAGTAATALLNCIHSTRIIQPRLLWWSRPQFAEPRPQFTSAKYKAIWRFFKQVQRRCIVHVLPREGRSERRRPMTANSCRYFAVRVCSCVFVTKLQISGRVIELGRRMCTMSRTADSLCVHRKVLRFWLCGMQLQNYIGSNKGLSYAQVSLVLPTG